MWLQTLSMQRIHNMASLWIAEEVAFIISQADLQIPNKKCYGGMRMGIQQPCSSPYRIRLVDYITMGSKDFQFSSYKWKADS